MWKLDKNGFYLENSRDILEEVKREVGACFNGIDTEEPSTPQGQFILYLTQLLENIQARAVEIANAFYNGGSGIWLDARNNSLWNNARKGEQKESVRVKVYGVVGTAIPYDFKVSGAGKEWLIADNQNYTIGNLGYVEAWFNCTEAGNNKANVGDIKTIEKSVQGIERVINDEPSLNNGRLIETDTEYRDRVELENGANINSKGNFTSLLSGLKALNGISKLDGYENYSTIPISYKGKTIAQHTINVVIESMQSAELDKAIGELIYRYKTPGCNIQGEVEIDVYDALTSIKSVMRFDRATYVDIKAELQVAIQKEVDRDYKTLLENQLLDIVATLPISKDILTFEIVKQLGVDKLEVVNFKIGKKDGTASEIIKLNYGEIARLDRSDISIELYEG